MTEKQIEAKLLDAKHCEITVRRDGKTVWINTEDGCVCRIQNIEVLTVIDKRIPAINYGSEGDTG